ncbi:DUF1062 domain-containing protein [Micromonospora sp. NPDC005806]|uniref:DUF1062 domain-containing protein n=1 Tax=Micromonospora sp. NPDC005806 TaxID=3364234 RepID=UPI0036C4D650
MRVPVRRYCRASVPCACTSGWGGRNTAERGRGGDRRVVDAQLADPAPQCSAPGQNGWPRQPAPPYLVTGSSSPTHSREDFTPRDDACSLELTPFPCIGRRRRRRLFSHAFRQVFGEIMSTRPHIGLSWTVRRTRLPLLAFRCVHCHSGLASTGDGKFRVNANGKPLDIWLLVACVSCNRTSKITLHDRVPVRYLDPTLLEAYSGNSSVIARVLLDSLIARRNRFALQWDSCWELLPPSPPESPWPIQISVIFDDPVPPSPRTAHRPGAGHQPLGDRSPRKDRHSAEPQNSQGLLVRPAMSRRRGPEPGREARWPCPGLHHAAVRAQSLMTGHERRSGPARYQRRR